MSLRLAERLMRFGLSVLAVAILLRLLALALPSGYISPVAERVPELWEGAIGLSLWESLLLFGRGFLMAMPLALFGGWLIRWGGAAGPFTDSIATALYGLPFFGMLMLVIYSVSLRVHWVPMGWATHLALVAGLWPLLSRSAGEGLRGDTPTALSVVGRMLGESGNVMIVSLIAGLFLIPDWGVLRLLELAVRYGDAGVIHMVLTAGVLPVLLCHLVSDLLLLRARPEGQAALPLGVWRLSIGLALASILIAMASLSGADITPLYDKFTPPSDSVWMGADEQGRPLLGLLGPSTRRSLAMALTAAGLSTAAGLVLAGAGRLLGPAARALLSPRVPAFSLWAPMVAAMGLLTVFGRSQATLVGALAVTGVLPMAFALRGLLAADSVPVRRTALLSLAGAAVLVLNQNLVAEMTLGALGIGLPPGVLSLGLLARGAVLVAQAPHMLVPALLAATGMAGLSLTGFTLLGTAPEAEEESELEPVEPAPEEASA